jgi:hypothetical protein
MPAGIPELGPDGAGAVTDTEDGTAEDLGGGFAEPVQAETISAPIAHASSIQRAGCGAGRHRPRPAMSRVYHRLDLAQVTVSFGYGEPAGDGSL